LIKTVSTFIKNIGFNMVADLSTKLVNSILILLLSHFLGVAAMGSYSVAHTYFTFGLLFSYWGLGNLLTREVARSRDNYHQYLSNFSIIRLTFAAVSILIINLIMTRFDYTQQTQVTIQIISIAILAGTIINLINALFIAFEELKYLSAISLTVSLLRIAVSYLVLRLGGGLLAIAISYTALEVLSLAISMAFAAHILKDFKFAFDLKFCINQIIKAFPFFWIALLVIFDSRIEILIISFFFNETQVGYYTAMNTLIGGVALFSEAIRNAVFPILARYQLQAPEKVPGMILMLGKYISLITFPIAISIFFFAEKLTFLFFDPGYTISVTLLQIVIWTFIGYSLTVVAIRLLMVHDKEKQVVLSLFISGALTLTASFLLAPRWGITGIAIIRLVTSYVLFFLCIFFISKQGYRIIEFSVLLRILFASLALFFTTYFLFPLNPYLSLLVGLSVYGGIVWLTRVIDSQDIKLWKDIFSNIFTRPFQAKNE